MGQRPIHGIPRSFGVAWSSWCDPGGPLKHCPESSNPRPAQSIHNGVAKADRDAERVDASAQGTGDLVKGGGLVHPGDRFDPREVLGLVKANQDVYPVSTMCRLLGVRISCVCRRERRPMRSLRSESGRFITVPGGPTGCRESMPSWPIAGLWVGRQRVARLMRIAGLQGVSRRKGTRTRIRGKEVQVISGPGEAELPCYSAKPSVGSGHHLHPDMGGVPLYWGSYWMPFPAGSGDGRGKRACGQH